ncbi:ribosome small subunit-dependent GTPase A [Longimicrobium terrae]|uniref:Small ribosomal subunit biogenesis GTPase RsgA n=1 Tax=Longimicrobium terrae TaxID=1639882 RepID=A0A841GY07_9BACT|nr:ribosome small subunit-dependent GTPase A [Longimicrobium terrae]MBB4636239.1 ribosome biogenesis GTPase [Longimicrobium terrae]MBB6070634.1 ribosome biogenesis GTPase [Longimicrobium terrae]
MLTGTIRQGQGGIYEVETPDGVVEASLRGRLKRDERSGGKVVVGDRVDLESEASGEGIVWAIQRVHERTTLLERRSPGKAPRSKPIVANVDQVLIVFAAANPDPHLRMLDRFLVIAGSSGIAPLIVINKVDVKGEAAARAFFAPYEKAGYRLLFTAAKAGIGVDELRESLCGRLSALTGPSGVGKSSLLNAIQPGLGLRVAAISEAVNKGKHTTVTAQLIPLDCGGWVADTPGLRELGLWEIDRDQLQFYFPEIERLLGGCRYPTCSHIHEPDCAIRTAVAAGELDAGRYDSYRRMVLGEDDF